MRNLKIDNINAKPYGESRFFTKETKEIINILKNLTPYDIQSDENQRKNRFSVLCLFSRFQFSR